MFRNEVPPSLCCSRLLLPAAFCALSFWANVANAGFMQSFPFSTSDNGSGNPVDVKVTFDTDYTTNTIVVTLENLVVNPVAVNQNLTGLFFSITTGQSSGTLDSSMADEVNVDEFGTPSAGSLGVSTGWLLINDAMDPILGTTGLYLDQLTAPGSAHSIIGAPDGSNVYSNAKGSIADNGPHNPFLDQVAKFSLTVAGLDATSQIGGVTFQFNTSAGTYFTPPELIPGVPEPSSLVLLSMGGLAVLGSRFRRHRLMAA
jgi:PEP-CTERM motif